MMIMCSSYQDRQDMLKPKERNSSFGHFHRLLDSFLRKKLRRLLFGYHFQIFHPISLRKKSLLSIASAVGKPLAVDKTTKDRTRSSAARVKVLLDLLKKHPSKVKLKIVDKKLGKLLNSITRLCLIIYQNIALSVSIKGMKTEYVACCRGRLLQLKRQLIL